MSFAGGREYKALDVRSSRPEHVRHVRVPDRIVRHHAGSAGFLPVEVAREAVTPRSQNLSDVLTGHH